MPILRGYMPGLLTQCQDSRTLAVRMVSTWLKQYMFAGDTDGETKASAVADWFADYESFYTHGRRVSPDEAIAKGLRITWLENDQKLQDTVLSVHHAAAHTFAGTPAVKIIENHHGRAWIKMSGQIVVPTQVQPPQVQPPITPAGAPQLNRAERRRLEKGRR